MSFSSYDIHDWKAFSLQAIVERDQLRIELAETQKRLKKLIDKKTDKIQQEKQNAEKICEERLKENAEKVTSERKTMT